MGIAEGDEWVACVRRAVAGERQAVRAVVDHLTPYIQMEVAKVLVRSAGARPPSLRAEVEELVQDVLLLLFSNEGRILVRWDPQRGASLASFVRLVARRHVWRKIEARAKYGSVTNSGSSRELDDIDVEAPALEASVAARDLLAKILRRLGDVLTDKGVQMFQLLLVEQRSVEDIAQATGLSREAIYKWRSRLKEEVDQAAQHVAGRVPPLRLATAKGARERDV